MFEIGLALILQQNEYSIINPKNDDNVFTSFETIPIGQIICSFRNLKVSAIKDIIMLYPSGDQLINVHNTVDALFWLKKQFTAKFGITNSILIFSEFCRFLEDYFNSRQKTIQFVKDHTNEKIKDFIFCNTEYSGPGNQNVKNLLLDALYIFTFYYSTVGYIFDSLLSGKNAKDIAKIYTDLAGIQHIDYKIVNLETGLTPVYTLESVFSMAAFEICNIFNQEVDIKRCKNCNKWFVPSTRSDTLYCDSISPQDSTKTCKEFGAERQYRENLKNNAAKGLYRKIYMSKQMLAKRNPDINDYARSFEKFKIESKQWKADIKLNTKSEDEYLNWLKTVKDKKVL
jgi:hypothetical protein